MRHHLLVVLEKKIKILNTAFVVAEYIRRLQMLIVSSYESQVTLATFVATQSEVEVVPQ